MTNENVLRQALAETPDFDEFGKSDFLVEAMGDEGFDWLAKEMSRGALTAHETIRALRLMSLLTRKNCIRRKGELLLQTLSVAENPTNDVAVRLAAARITVIALSIVRPLGDAVLGGQSIANLDARAIVMARTALELGVSPEESELFREYLHARAKLALAT